MSDRMVIALPETIRDGVECEVLDDGTGVIAAVEVAGHGTVTVPRAWLKPVLPTEPPVGAIVACGIGPNRSNPLPLFRHWVDGWGEVGDPGVAGSRTWAAVCAYAREHAQGVPVVFVPEPDVEWLTEQLVAAGVCTGYEQTGDARAAIAARDLLDAMRSRT